PVLRHWIQGLVPEDLSLDVPSVLQLVPMLADSVQVVLVAEAPRFVRLLGERKCTFPERVLAPALQVDRKDAGVEVRPSILDLADPRPRVLGAPDDQITNRGEGRSLKIDP